MKSERRYVRIKLHSEVVLRDGMAPEEGVAVNISLGGMYVRARNERPLGNEVEVEFILPPRKRIRTKAYIVRVVRHSDDKYPMGYGISFLKLPPEGKSEIDSYVRNSYRALRALYYELHRASVNEKKVAELVKISPIEHQYPQDILKEIVASELSNLKLRPGKERRKTQPTE